MTSIQVLSAAWRHILPSISGHKPSAFHAENATARRVSLPGGQRAAFYVDRCLYVWPGACGSNFSATPFMQ